MFLFEKGPRLGEVSLGSLLGFLGRIPLSLGRVVFYPT